MTKTDLITIVDAYTKIKFSIERINILNNKDSKIRNNYFLCTGVKSLNLDTKIKSAMLKDIERKLGHCYHYNEWYHKHLIKKGYTQQNADLHAYHDNYVHVNNARLKWVNSKIKQYQKKIASLE